MVLISTPWILRIYGYFTFEDITRDRQVSGKQSRWCFVVVVVVVVVVVFILLV